MHLGASGDRLNRLGAILVGLGAYVRFSDTSSTDLGHPQRARRTKHPKTGATNIDTTPSRKGWRVPRRASNYQGTVYAAYDFQAKLLTPERPKKREGC